MGAAELRDAAARFNDLAAEITQRHAHQTAILAGVAHDLRTPLHTLKASLGLLEPSTPALTEHRHAALSVARRQVDRLDRMIGDFVSASLVEAGQLELCLEARDIVALVSGCVTPFRDAPSNREITVTAPEEPVVVLCDAARLEQVMSNLLENALKYSHPGRAIRVSIAAERAYAVVSVSDDGIGIPLEEQRRLFEPFRRAKAARAASIPGVGLGLFICRRIVQAHAGSVELRSAPGRGATFTVRLPRLSAGAQAAPSPGRARPGGGAGPAGADPAA
jgi:signal transduction histidine kinase